MVRTASGSRSPTRYWMVPPGRPVAGRAQHGVDQVGRRGLAVRAGDADQGQRARVAQHGGRERASASRASGTWTQDAAGCGAGSDDHRDRALARGPRRRTGCRRSAGRGSPRTARRARPARVVRHGPTTDASPVSRASGSGRSARPSVTAPSADAGGRRPRRRGPVTEREVATAASIGRARLRAPACTTRPDPFELHHEPAAGGHERRLARGEAAQVGHQARLACRAPEARPTGLARPGADADQPATAQARARIVAAGCQGAAPARRCAAKSGAATSPPWLAAPRGVSSETRIDQRRPRRGHEADEGRDVVDHRAAGRTASTFCAVPVLPATT